LRDEKKCKRKKNSFTCHHLVSQARFPSLLFLGFFLQCLPT
jgi:hypothetical protein